jgi:hypothetical protein
MWRALSLARHVADNLKSIRCSLRLPWHIKWIGLRDPRSSQFPMGGFISNGTASTSTCTCACLPKHGHSDSLLCTSTLPSGLCKANLWNRERVKNGLQCGCRRIVAVCFASVHHSMRSCPMTASYPLRQAGDAWRFLAISSPLSSFFRLPLFLRSSLFAIAPETSQGEPPST